MAVSHRKTPDVKLAPVADGQATVKTTTRNQSFYFSYDGALTDGGYYLIPSIVEPFPLRLYLRRSVFWRSLSSAVTALPSTREM